MKWMTRAKDHFSDMRAGGTPITTKSLIVGVMGAAPLTLNEYASNVSGVLGVIKPSLSENANAEDFELMWVLIEAAMHRCDAFNDGPAARAEMEADCRATPPHQQQDLLAYFHGVCSMVGKDAG